MRRFSQLLENKIFLVSIVLFDVFMSVAATVVDWSDFFTVPWYLVPFVPICPLYPFLLALCFAWRLILGKTYGFPHEFTPRQGGGIHPPSLCPPQAGTHKTQPSAHCLILGLFPKWLLFFTSMGIISYALMAPIFYPLYMSVVGFGWYELGNIFWVFLYGSQIFLIWPYMTWPQAKIQSLFAAFFLGSYFIVKDFTDFFLGTFSYQREGMLPPSLAKIFFFSILTIHLGTWVFLIFRTTHSRLPDT